MSTINWSICPMCVKRVKDIKDENNNYDYFMKLDTTLYAGMWIVIDKQKVIDSDKNLGVLIKRTNIRNKFIAKIPSKNSLRY